MKMINIILCLIAVFLFISCSAERDNPNDPLSDNHGSGSPSDVAITAFSITSPVTAAGIITEATHTIAVTVPFGTVVTALVPTITISSGASISPASGVARNFTSPVTYTVTAADAWTQGYVVTVKVADNYEKEITAFTFPTSTATTITETNHTIAVTVPYGTNVTALVPTITHTGASISPASGVARNFTSPVTYTVTASDSTTQAYTVTVTVAAPKAITAFSFPTSTATTITEATHTIAVTVPNGTNVTALVPTITHTGASISPASGVARNFTNPVTYTVTAADSSTQAYTVTVTVAPPKAITAFSFASPAATGTINETNHTVAVAVPFGTNITALVPTITISPGASINPASGVARNFTSPVTYTVTAADSSTQAYVVTVSYLAAVTTTAIVGNLSFTIDIAGTSAKGGGNVTNQGSSLVTERGLCWNTTGSPTISNSHASDFSGTGVFANVSLTGLTVNTTYYVRAYATNSEGTAYGNQITFNSGRIFGTDIFGGYVFYNDGTGHGLVSAKTNQSTGFVWIGGGSTQTTLNGNTSVTIGSGYANSNAIVAQTGHTGSAAKVCLDYSDGTYSDWFMPSWDELYLMYAKLWVIGVGSFAADVYFSSSENSATSAVATIFDSGGGSLGAGSKAAPFYVRAARAF